MRLRPHGGAVQATFRGDFGFVPAQLNVLQRNSNITNDRGIKLKNEILQMLLSKVRGGEKAQRTPARLTEDCSHLQTASQISKTPNII